MSPINWSAVDLCESSLTNLLATHHRVPKYVPNVCLYGYSTSISKPCMKWQNNTTSNNNNWKTNSDLWMHIQPETYPLPKRAVHNFRAHTIFLRKPALQNWKCIYRMTKLIVIRSISKNNYMHCIRFTPFVLIWPWISFTFFKNTLFSSQSMV